MSLTEIERDIRRRLRDDFRHYAKKALKIRTKDGTVEPFILNRAQDYIHDRLEQQIADTGKVRALILKGRQQDLAKGFQGGMQSFEANGQQFVLRATAYVLAIKNTNLKGKEPEPNATAGQ